MLHANRIIVLAPHVADEALGCGGWLSKLRRERSEAPHHEKETSTMTTTLDVREIPFHGDVLVGGVADDDG